MVLEALSSVGSLCAMSDDAPQQERLAQALALRQKSAQQLAVAIGVTYQAIKKVIDGKTTALTAFNTFEAAKALNISAEWLATGRGDMLSAAVCPLTEQLRQTWLQAAEPERRMAENAARNVLGLDAIPRSERASETARSKRIACEVYRLPQAACKPLPDEGHTSQVLMFPEPSGPRNKGNT